MKSGLFMDKILDACTVSVLDPGPYSFEKKMDWSNALVGDRFYALLQIRILTFGDNFAFKLQCSQTGCRQRFPYEISLSKDLPVKLWTDEDRALFAAGNLFSFVDSNGKKITYKLPIGKDEVAAAKNTISFDGAFLQALQQRIVSIEGEQVPRTYLENLPFSALFGLVESMDQHNCGVEDKIEIQCPYCDGLEDVQIPFAQGFLSPPNSVLKKSRKA